MRNRYGVVLVLPSFGKRVRDSLLAINAGFAALDLPLERVLPAGAQFLPVEVHVPELMTVAAFVGIRSLYIFPHVLREV